MIGEEKSALTTTILSDHEIPAGTGADPSAYPRELEAED